MEPFFTLDGGEFTPSPHARGPWSPDMLHGRLLGGLMARQIERDVPADGLRPARLTVDLFKNAKLAPLRVTTALIRQGRRIRVVDATVHSPAGLIARATCVLLRAGDQPADGPGWTAPTWDAGPPGEAPQVDASAPFLMWPVDGQSWTGDVRRRAWIREVRPLVDDEPYTPFVRAAQAADLASPMTHWGPGTLSFINADYTLHLARLPEGDTLGIEAGGHLSSDGIAVGHAVVYDAKGPVGHSDTTAVVTAPLGS
ncbi:thioesterase family protein [Actinocorallia sp. API 0066]|nr:acyl-CoA thioesterase domain-containing protein [Actinocorallia sp. API 0066]MCD0448719.1 thioesterase family protein [Actinocorallia sp. API 0066]